MKRIIIDTYDAITTISLATVIYTYLQVICFYRCDIISHKQ